MIIGNCDINQKVFIIAEIGNNHEGSFALAKEIISAAAQAGADAVKFQTIVPERLVSVCEAPRLAQLKKFRLSYRDFGRLSQATKREGVVFLSTPFDLSSVTFLNRIVPAFKVSSADNNFFPLLAAIARTGKPVILSAGLSLLSQIEQSVAFIRKAWKGMGIRQEIALLHCVSLYPVPPAQANLRSIKFLAESLCLPVGYSDHTVGIDAPVLAVALGAKIVEKHFTLDRHYSGFRDHQLSADPVDFKKMVARIRLAEQMLGEEKKELASGEELARLAMRRSIVAGRPLKKGEVLKLSDLDWLRPGSGLAPGAERRILGRALLRPLKKGELILEKDVC